jgi:hypothetical protein
MLDDTRFAVIGHDILKVLTHVHLEGAGVKK